MWRITHEFTETSPDLFRSGPAQEIFIYYNEDSQALINLFYSNPFSRRA